MEAIHSFISALAMFPILSVTTLFLLSPPSSHLLQVQATIKIERNFSRIPLSGPIGPEAFAFDPAGGGPYASVSDGRVLKWQGDKFGWIEFATTSHQRNKEECDGTDDPEMEDKCGRPLGLRFNEVTGDLYIVDAYFGLLTVGRHGGVATQLATGAEGAPFRFTNSVDIDQASGLVYFTDSSTFFQRRDNIWVIFSQDNTGRLIEYDPKSKKVTVLLRGLFFANGVALSKDKTFLLAVETSKGRVLRYWLQGPKRGRCEVFAQLPGFPDNVSRSSKGEFWVALNHGGQQHQKMPFSNARERKVVLTSISKFNLVQPWMDFDIVGVKISEEGKIMEMLYVSDTTIADFVSELREENERLWLGSEVLPFAGVSKL